MELTSNYLLTILSILLIGLVGLYLIISKIIQKYFSNYFTWLLLNTIFVNYYTMIWSFRFVFLVFTIGVYYEFKHFLWGGVLYLILYLILLYKILNNHLKGIFSFKDNFEFHKYSLSIEYFQKLGKSKGFREVAFNSFIGKFTDIPIANSNKIFGHYVSDFSKHFTLEDFEHFIDISDSKKNSIHLFFNSFKINLNKTLREIRLLTRDEKKIVETLSTSYFLDFDGSKGLHYDRALIYMKINESKQQMLVEKIQSIEKEKKNSQNCLRLIDDKLNQNQKQIESLAQKVSNLFSCSEIKTNISEDQLAKYFESYIEILVSDKNRRLTLKLEFLNFVSCLFNHKGKKFSKIELTNEELKGILSFFRYLYDRKILDYQIVPFLKIISKITNTKYAFGTLELNHKIKLPYEICNLIEQKLRAKNIM